MNKKKKKDNIDLELTKAYFSNSGKNKIPEKGKTPKPGPRPVRAERSKMLPAVLVILVALVFFAVYLLKNTGDILSNPTPSVTKQETAIRKRSLKDLFPVISAAKPVGVSAAEEAATVQKTLYDFEKDDNGWEIPGWELDKEDHVARVMKQISGPASKGTGSMGLYAEFSGGRWTGALVEIQQYLDLSKYDWISADIYLPPDCPTGLRGKLIFTVGEDWRFVEMSRSIRLEPGKWTTITASISEGSFDWKRTQVDKAFKEDVRKVAIRIESNRKPAYKGPIYIDNIRVYSVEK